MRIDPLTWSRGFFLATRLGGELVTGQAVGRAAPPQCYGLALARRMVTLLPGAGGAGLPFSLHLMRVTTPRHG